MQIESRSYASALVTLNDFVNLSVTTAAAGNVNLTQASYLLSAIVNGFGNQTVGQGVSEVFNNFLNLRYTISISCTLTHIKQLVLSTASGLLEIAQIRVENGINV